MLKVETIFIWNAKRGLFFFFLREIIQFYYFFCVSPAAENYKPSFLTRVSQGKGESLDGD